MADMNPLPALISSFRQAHRMTQKKLGQKVGLSASRIQQLESGTHLSMRKDNLDNLLFVISQKPKTQQKERHMSFEAYIPKTGSNPIPGERVRISTSGSITLSRDLVKSLDLKEGVRRKLYWDKTARQIGIEFGTKEGEGFGAVSLNASGSALFNALNFFRTFRIRLPAKPIDLGVRLEPKLPGWIVIDYPEKA